jgi:hypothetical protein
MKPEQSALDASYEGPVVHGIVIAVEREPFVAPEKPVASWSDQSATLASNDVIHPQNVLNAIWQQQVADRAPDVEASTGSMDYEARPLRRL